MKINERENWNANASIFQESACSKKWLFNHRQHPVSRRLIVIENRFDLRALINVYAWSVARPLWHKGADKSRNRGRGGGGVRCPDEEGCSLVSQHRRKDEWNDQIEFQPDTRAAVLSAFSPPRHAFQIHLLDRDAICVHFTESFALFGQYRQNLRNF